MFIAITKYTKPLEEVNQFRPAHHEYIKKGIHNGLILVTGRRNGDDAGGTIISQEIPREQFEDFMKNEPFFKGKVAIYEIHEFKPVFYNDSLKPLLESTVPFKSVPLPKDEDLPKETREFLGQLPPLNVFRMFSNLPRSLPPFIQLAKSFLSNGYFPIALHEVGILRIAHVSQSPYEWTQHVQMAKGNGITNEEILLISKEDPVRSLSEEKNFACKIADEIARHSNISQDTFNTLYSRYGIQAGTEVILCLSFYRMLACFLNCTRVPLEAVNPLEGLSSPLGNESIPIID